MNGGVGVDFHKLIPHSGDASYTFQNNNGDDDTQYDSRQAHFFALGCNHSISPNHNLMPYNSADGAIAGGDGPL